MFFLKSEISFSSLNTRGLKDNTKRKAIFLFCKGLKANCFFLQETHSSEEDTTFWKNQWGDNIIFSHGSNRSGGVAICFYRFPGTLITSKGDNNGHWITAVVNLEGNLALLINIYGYNDTAQNKLLLETLTDIISEYKNSFAISFTLVGGDFNMVIDEWLDRCPSAYNTFHHNNLMKNFIDANSLVDVWRENNTDSRQFTWIKPNGRARSRIDFWLTTPEITNLVDESSISTAPLTDHCVINITLKPQNLTSRKGYWKFNAELLNNDEYVEEVKSLFDKIINDDEIDTYCKKWEYFKFKVRNLSIKFSKLLCKQQREIELKLVQELNKYSQKVPLSDEDTTKLVELQTNLDTLFTKRAQGAYVRSRAKWIEQGEKNSSYFFLA